jgi:hypothetical protein
MSAGEGQPSILEHVQNTNSDSGHGSDYSVGIGDNNGRSTTRVLVIAMAIVLVIILLCSVMAPRRGSLSHRLAKHGWVLFVRDGCGYCTKQMHELDGHYSAVVECAPGGKLVKSDVPNPPFTCSQITGFPTWYSTKTKETKTGLQKKADLEKMLSD